MKAIKNFIYLDEYKMYSISSQIFEGITEYLIDYQKDTTGEKKQQVPDDNGRIMADILKSQSGTQEKRYLHDYSYKLFEDYLQESEKILSLSAENISEKITQIDEKGFIKVRAKAVFNDINIIKSTIEKFNELGKALTYIIDFSEMEEGHQQLERMEKSIKDRNQKARSRQKLKSTTNIEKLARNRGLNLDSKLLEKLAFVLDYGFQDQFTVQMPMGPYTFSADCKRDDLREDEHSLIRKYARFSEKEFVLVGTIAQSPSKSIDRQESNEDGSETQHLKEAIMVLVERLSAVESEFSGKLANEIIVDPIAIYREI